VLLESSVRPVGAPRVRIKPKVYPSADRVRVDTRFLTEPPGANSAANEHQIKLDNAAFHSTHLYEGAADLFSMAPSKTRDLQPVPVAPSRAASRAGFLEPPTPHADLDDDQRRIFDLFDVSGTGRISLSDMCEAAALLGLRMSKDQIFGIIDRADDTGDGELDEVEFKAMLAQFHLPSRSATPLSYFRVPTPQPFIRDATLLDGFEAHPNNRPGSNLGRIATRQAGFNCPRQ
jgi:hypothetical protein